MPEMVEFWSWLLPMVEVETNAVPLEERSCPCVYEVALVPPLPIPKVPVRRFVPMEVVAMIEPLAFTASIELARLVIAKVEEVALVSVVLPLKVLLSERRVEEAAVIVLGG